MRIVVVKDTMSAMVKLAREIDESASDFFGHGMVSYPMASSRDFSELRLQLTAKTSEPVPSGLPAQFRHFLVQALMAEPHARLSCNQPTFVTR